MLFSSSRPTAEADIDRLIRMMEARQHYTVITFNPELCKRLAVIEERYFTPGTAAADGYEAFVLEGFAGCPIVTLMATSRIAPEQLRQGLIGIGWPEEQASAIDDLRPETVVVMAEPEHFQRDAHRAGQLLAALKRRKAQAAAQWN